MTTFKIIDSVMGSGKTTAIIQDLLYTEPFLGKTIEGSRFIIVTPFLSEMDRYINPADQPRWNTRFFVEPETKSKNGKLGNFKDEVKKDMNIVITHALFQMLDRETIDLLKEKHYTLIVDEVPEVVTPYSMKYGDLKMMIDAGYVSVRDNGLLNWNEDKEYDGDRNIFREDCRLNRILYDKNTKSLFRIYPYEVFTAFDTVYVLTYMFEAQLIYYYFKYYGFEYRKFMPFEKSMFSEGMQLAPSDLVGEYVPFPDFKSKIHICDNDKMNEIGDNRNSLSSTWYKNHSAKSPEIVQLKRNMHNFFQNICHAKAGDCMWTVVKEYKDKLSGAGYSKSFVQVSSRATNEYRDRTSIAYMANRFINPMVTNFFESAGVDVDQDGYALSEMVQFIWRSAIRDGKEINLYIPSKRMRNLLMKWLEDGYLHKGSPKKKQIEKEKKNNQPPRKPRGWMLDE